MNIHSYTLRTFGKDWYGSLKHGDKLMTLTQRQEDCGLLCLDKRPEDGNSVLFEELLSNLWIYKNRGTFTYCDLIDEWFINDY